MILQTTVTELAKQGTLKDIIEMKMLTKRTDKVKMAMKIARGLNYLHSYGVCHRDLKASNVLVQRVVFRMILFATLR